MGDHQVGGIGEGLDLGRVDVLAGDRLVADPGQGGDFGGDSAGGLTEPIERVADAEDAAVDPERERDHGQFDDFVTAVIQTGGFDIDEQPVSGRRSVVRK